MTFSNIISVTFNKQSKKTFGFTLAELLITLGTIGIIAALTIPTIYTNYLKRQTITRLKATYATIANAIKLSESENGDVGMWNFTRRSADNFDQYLLPYLKADKKEYSAGALKYTCANGSNCGALSIAHMQTAVYSLPSGVDLITLVYNNNEAYLDIIADLNGVKNQPNKLGRDIFYMIVHPQYGFRMSAENQGEANHGTTSIKDRNVLLNGPASYGYNCKALGIWCGALIQKDNWEIRKDYPW